MPKDENTCGLTQPLLKWRVKKKQKTKIKNNTSNKEQHQKALLTKRIASWTRRHRWSMCVLLLKCLKFFEMSQSGREKGTWSGRRLPREHHGWTRSRGCDLLSCDTKTSKQIVALFSDSRSSALEAFAFFPELCLVGSRFLMQTRVHLEINNRWQKSSFAAVIYKM